MLEPNGHNGTKKNDLDKINEEIIELELKNNWHEAISHYFRILRLFPEKETRAQETISIFQIWEKIAYCYYRASRKSKYADDFSKFGKLAMETYRKAAKLYSIDPSLIHQANSDKCNAIAEYISFWLSSTPQEKKETLEKSQFYGKNSLKKYEDSSNLESYGIMANYMLLFLFENFYIASDWHEMRDIVKEAKYYIRKALENNSDNKDELLLSYALGSLLSWYSANLCESEDERRELIKNSINYSKEGLELFNQVINSFNRSFVYWAATYSTLLFTKNIELSIEYAKKMLENGVLSGDNYLKGIAYYLLAFATNWFTIQQDDIDKKRHGNTEIIQYAKEAIRNLQLVSHHTFIAQAYWLYSESSSNMAIDIETSLAGKKSRIENAIDTGRKGLEHARKSGSQDATGTNLHALSKALQLSSNYYTAKSEKGKLLEEALIYREELNDILQKIYPFNDWTHGVGLSYKGFIEGEMAKNSTNQEEKIALLDRAISDMEHSISLCKKVIESRPVPTLIAACGKYLHIYGGFLEQLYFLTNNEEYLQKAIIVYEDASIKYKKINLPTRAAESYWKEARNYYRLKEHNKSATNFEKAFIEYEDAANKNHHFAHVFHEYANYMQAWNNIEKARYYHSIFQYDKEHDFYQNAAILHQKTKRWKYLNETYLAWAKLAKAEDLSRKENTTKARDLFKETADLFVSGKNAIQSKINTIDEKDEKEMAIELLSASDSRMKYCQGRIELEEAKLYDKKGEHLASSKKYALAANIIQSIIDNLPHDEIDEELQPILHLCKAWQKMTQAEVEASPELYKKASDQFEKATKYGTDQKTKLLIMGHSSFCKALEAGTRYEISKEENLHSELVRNLGNAINLYIKADFEPAVEYSKGTHHVFDAYLYLNKATEETDPRKKARFYELAERVLEASLEAFSKAKHPEKRNKVSRLLSSVKQDRNLALSLSEILETPTFSSSTMSFQTPTPSYEQPVGVERFNNADIHARIFLSNNVVTSGEEFDLELELYNTGQISASLVRVEDLVPEDFEVSKVPGYYSYDGNILDLKGRKVGPLNSVEILFRVKPHSKGEFVFMPRIEYYDETGKKSHSEPEPVNISVREMGILSWLLGSRPSY
jgi:hypothetical protein